MEDIVVLLIMQKKKNCQYLIEHVFTNILIQYQNWLFKFANILTYLFIKLYY